MVHSLAPRKKPTRVVNKPKLRLIKGGTHSVTRKTLDRRIKMHEDALQFLGKQDLGAKDLEFKEMRDRSVNDTSNELQALKHQRDKIDFQERQAERRSRIGKTRIVTSRRKTV